MLETNDVRIRNATAKTKKPLPVPASTSEWHSHTPSQVGKFIRCRVSVAGEGVVLNYAEQPVGKWGF